MIGLSNSEKRYGWVSMAFHWAVVVIIGASVWYAYSRGFIPREQRDVRRAIMMLHFDWSWVVLGVVALRIFWKALSTAPREINDDKRLILAHKLVTGALLWMPVLLTISGAAAVWGAARDVQAFGFTVIKGMAERDDLIHDITEIAHVGLWYVFAGLLALHVVAALWHHAVKKDDTLNRMVPWGKV